MYPDIVNGIGKIYSLGLKKGFGSKFRGSSRVRQETPESRRMYRPKCSAYNKDEDEDNSPNILNDKHHLASSQKSEPLSPSHYARITT